MRKSDMLSSVILAWFISFTWLCMIAIYVFYTFVAHTGETSAILKSLLVMVYYATSLIVVGMISLVCISRAIKATSRYKRYLKNEFTQGVKER